MKPRLARYNECTGCGACYASCKSGAIKFDYDKNGFLRPTIELSKCTKCGLCEKKCLPLNQDKINFHNTSGMSCYTSWTLDDDLCLQAKSGGIFAQLAKNFISEDKAYAVGAKLSDHNTCDHVIISTSRDLKPLLGSKYMQSNAGIVYEEIRNLLKSKNKVLFSGTPCQVAALYHYLGKIDLTQLYTIEVLCHGTPSKIVTDLCSKYYGAKNILSFSNKKEGWCLKGLKRVCYQITLKKEDRTIFSPPKRDLFYKCFGLLDNPSCYECKFTRPERCADITLGDQWGLHASYPKRSKLGASSVICNTDKGRKLFLNSPNLFIEENKLSTLNSPTMICSNRYLRLTSFAKELYWIKKLPINLSASIISYNWRKTWLLLPIVALRAIIIKKHNKEIAKKIIEVRKKNNWN